MKRKLMQFLMLSGFLLTSSTALADYEPTADDIAAAKTAAKAVAIEDFQFSGNYYATEVGNMRFDFDTTNKLANFIGYSGENQAPEEFTVPEYVVYNDELYIVASVGGDYYYWYYYYEQPQVKKVTLPETVRLIRQYFYSRYDSVHVFEIPATVEQIEGSIIDRENVTFSFKGAIVPNVTGYLYNNSSSKNKLKLRVPKASMKEYYQDLYLEKCCIVADDFTYDSEVNSSTIVVDVAASGELGYLVVGSEILKGNPEGKVYSDVNKLIVKSGQIDATDWEAIRNMENLVYLDVSGLDIEEMPANALYDCWQIERVILPASLKTIQRSAFYRTGVKDLVLPEGLTAINDSYNFYDCDSLTSIVIPDGVPYLGYECFYSCENLHSVKLPASLAEMGNYCFEYCDLYTLNIPGALKTVGYYGFRYNQNLKKLTFEEGVERVDDYAFGECAIDTLKLPASMRQIDYAAFIRNPTLVDLQLNEGLEEIDGYAFQDCIGLTEVTLPSSLIYCLESPFYNCTGLQKIRAMSLLPPTVRSNVPTRNAGTIVVYVPMWSWQEYTTTPGWLEYANHMEIDPTILPENIVINKEFEFILNNDVSDYTPNIRMLYNVDEIDDGFGNTKKERGNLTIASAAKLAVNNFSMYVSPFAKYHADASRYYYNNNYKYDAWRTNYNPNSLVVKGAMRAEDQTYTLMTCHDLWQFISFPFDVKVSDIVPEDDRTQWVVRRYDGEARAAADWSADNNNTWVNLTADDVMEAGKGYIMKCYNNNYGQGYWGGGTPIVFTVKPVTESTTRQYLFASTDRKLSLAEYSSEFPQNRSWNLVGNPYPCYFDTRYMQYADMPADYQDGTSFLIWNSFNGDYRAFNTVDDDYILNPGEAIFIQRPVEDGSELVFLKGGRQTYRNPNDLTVTESARFRAPQAGRSVVNLVLSNGEQNDQTRVVISEKASLKYEIGRDAAKMNAMNAETMQLWSIGGRTNYAINERPEDDGVIELGMRLTADGIHTLSLGEKSAEGFYLEDRAMGTITELTAEGYTFQAEAGTITGRFALRTAGAVTGIANIAAQQQENGVQYNLNGQRVSNQQRGIVVKNGKKVFNK